MESMSELHELTDKLSSYIKRMRDIRAGRNHVESSAFFKSVDAMEKEMLNLRNMYEREMDKIRQKVDDLSRQKNHYQLQADKNEALASELQDRVMVETERIRKLTEEAQGLQVALNEKDSLLQNIMAQTHPSLGGDVHQQSRKLDELTRENMDLKRRYEAEQLMRREEEDKRHQLQQKLSFGEQVHAQHMKDLQHRLSASTNTVLSLEAQLRAGDFPQKDLAAILEQVRDAADSELTRYKEMSDDSFNRTLSMLKAQMEADNASFQALTAENRRLLNGVEELNAENHKVQAAVVHMQYAKKTAEENLRLERENAAKHILSLENKLKDFQEMLFEKLREFNTSHEVTQPLRTEIDSLKKLLQDEEVRASLLPPISPYRSHQVHPGNDEELDTNNEPLFPDRFVTKSSSPRPSSAAGKGMVRRPLSGGPVGPISAIRPQSSVSGDVPLSTAEEDKSSLEFKDSEGQENHFNQEFLKLQSQAESRPASTATYDYNRSTNSSTGDLKIYEVHPDGKYIRIINNGRKDADFGGYILQQNVGGNPVAVYRFPLRITLKAGAFITVYSGSNDPILHQPPKDFVWTEQGKWGTGPECTSILCKPNGQAVAWTTAAHRFGKVEYPQILPPSQALAANDHKAGNAPDVAGELPLYERDPNRRRDEAVYLRREKSCPPALAAQKHPHGESPHSAAHPASSQARPLVFGNDNSSYNTQSRNQSRTPDPVPGQPYSGACGQRMGSALLLRYVAPKAGNIRRDGALTKRKEPGQASSPPSSFMSPHTKFQVGIEQLKSQQNGDFLPPMPRPPLFSSW